MSGFDIRTVDTEKPFFFHDCDRCEFLGGVNLNTLLNGYRRFDIYVCSSTQGHNLDSILARYGNNGPEYLSYILGALNTKPVNLTELPDDEFWGHDELEILMKQRYEFWLKDAEYFRRLKKKQFKAIKDSEKGEKKWKIMN
jgi:hypothetical protein